MAVIDSAELLLRGHIYSGSGAWQDQSGNGHHGTATGATYNATDKCFDFDTSGEEIRVPHHADLDIADGVGVTIMIVCETSDNSIDWQYLCGKKANTGTGNAGYMYWIPTNGIPRGMVSDGTLYVGANAPSGITNDTKTVVAFRRSPHTTGDDDIQTHIDGSAGAPSTDPTTATLANAIDFMIGNGATNGEQLIGKVYDVAMWRTDLSDADIATAGTEILQTAVELTATILSTSTVGVSSLALSQENAFTLIPDGDQTRDSVINEQGATSFVDHRVAGPVSVRDDRKRVLLRQRQTRRGDR